MSVTESCNLLHEAEITDTSAVPPPSIKKSEFQFLKRIVLPPDIKHPVSSHGTSSQESTGNMTSHDDKDKAANETFLPSVCKNVTFLEDEYPNKAKLSSTNQLCQVDGFSPATSVKFLSQEDKCFQAYTAIFSMTGRSSNKTQQNSNHHLHYEHLRSQENCKSLPSYGARSHDNIKNTSLCNKNLAHGASKSNQKEEFKYNPLQSVLPTESKMGSIYHHQTPRLVLLLLCCVVLCYVVICASDVNY